MNCGIVILNYNSYGLTKKLVDHCLTIKCIDKIIIVDNASLDDFSNDVKQWNNDKIHYIKSEINNGYACGNNIGLKWLKQNNCRIAFVANPDVWFEESTIKNIINTLNDYPQYAACSCKRYMHESGKTGQFWWIPTFNEALMESLHFGRRKLYKKFQEKSYEEIEKSKGENIIDVEVVGGAFYGCNMDIMEKIGYLDERTFLWYEENILGYKIKSSGYKIAFINNVFYNHNHAKHQHGNKKIRVFLSSKRLFCYNYLRINLFQKLLLGIFDIIGTIEEYLICLIFN